MEPKSIAPGYLKRLPREAIVNIRSAPKVFLMAVVANILGWGLLIACTCWFMPIVLMASIPIDILLVLIWSQQHLGHRGLRATLLSLVVRTNFQAVWLAFKGLVRIGIYVFFIFLGFATLSVILSSGSKSSGHPAPTLGFIEIIFDWLPYSIVTLSEWVALSILVLASSGPESLSSQAYQMLAIKAQRRNLKQLAILGLLIMSGCLLTSTFFELIGQGLGWKIQVGLLFVESSLMIFCLSVMVEAIREMCDLGPPMKPVTNPQKAFIPKMVAAGSGLNRAILLPRQKLKTPS